MSRILYGRLFLQLRRKEISVEKFLKSYNPIGNLSNFTEVTESNLGRFRQHETAHGKVWKDRNISYKYYLSNDRSMALTIPDEEEYYAHASQLTIEELINLLKEAHNPENADVSQLAGTDYFVYQILSGQFNEKEIENYVVAEVTKKK